MVLIKQPLIVAHRGASGSIPENTVLSIATAMAGQADMIEFDVQLTKDQEVVLFHDSNLYRICGLTKSIGEMSLLDLKELDVGSWKDQIFSHIRIPTLTEVLQATRHFPTIIEIKPDKMKPVDRKLEEHVVDLLEDWNFNKLGYISVRDEDTYQWFRDHTNYRIGFMQKRRSVSTMIDLLNSLDLDIIQVRSQQCSSEDYHKFEDLGVEVFVYFADSIEDWEFFRNQPVTGVLTNYPTQIRAYLNMLSV